MDHEFAASVRRGLSSTPKTLESKYLYDEAGDALFRRITDAPEYYLTRAEFEILTNSGAEILELAESGQPYDVVELGAGDGSKSAVLLRAALDAGHDVRFVPIDIAPSALDHLRDRMTTRLPSLRILPTQGDYLTGLRDLHEASHRAELVLFLGSNIGNYDNDESIALLSSLRDELTPQDALLIGFDLRKDPRRIHDAYNDAAGLTTQFNLNLLARINRELGGSFDTHHFDHYECYDPVTGIAASYLVSLREQTVRVEALDTSFRFGRNELVHTEISRKYSADEIEAIAAGAGLRVEATFYDANRDFADVLMRPAPDPG